MNKNILIVGVGGQGTLLTSRIIGNLAVREGYDVKVSEVHGMAQRGGNVVTHVKYGNHVYSPLVESGSADIILAFEKLEALRWIHFLKKDGIIIVNNQSIDPIPVLMGIAQYPENAIEKIKQRCDQTIIIDALIIAQKCGSEKAINTVLLGVLAKYLNISVDHWIQIISETVPLKSKDINIKAFSIGYSS